MAMRWVWWARSVVIEAARSRLREDRARPSSDFRRLALDDLVRRFLRLMLDRHPHLGQPAPDPVAAQPATREVRDRQEINHSRTIAHQIGRLEFTEFQRSFRGAGSAARTGASTEYRLPRAER